MEYKGYKIIEKENCIIVEDVRDFNPVHIFECGQCFRWSRQEDGSYTGVVGGKAANVSYCEGSLYISNSNYQDFVDTWFEYFDLGRNYSEIKKQLSKDKVLKEAVKFGYGIRLLKQDVWETLISFIISSNNRIPRIMKTIATLAEAYGDKIECEGTTYYSFPRLEKMSGLSLEQIGICRGGFRCKYIYNSSKMISEGIIDLKSIGNLSVTDARNTLVKLSGVGNKVADCVLLFTGLKQEVFPTDVWVKRVMEELYFKREASFEEIQAFAAEYFGEYAGLAQQYLFYYARENKIGVK